ncbi:Gfo/Idh/MocA family oxidoreductase [Paraglaciecola aquimarina]|uniref:Gfo/Idh/MocA family oxidoreductase n=1 Tax=Paraglaciecola aquimarina TaxID=1235557 RepID=A0ABU3SVM6_9ALTE|nr:Gfo/Idh/MocA family oxidoreductase [Paraglaciecola aquimarina]MDU0354073.1 Gfo/Idh/MocA family oxidoreductase [Paraglaciecola aquimarina]
MNKLKWGIVSAGRIASKFCTDLAYHEHSEIHGVAARNLASAKQFAEKFQIQKAYQGYQAMFDDPEIDVVYIGTPTPVTMQIHEMHF